MHQSHLQPLFSMGLVLRNKLFHISTICTYVGCVECVTLSLAVPGFGIASETIETQCSHD